LYLSILLSFFKMAYSYNKKQILSKILLATVFAATSTSVYAFSFSDFLGTVKKQASTFVQNNQYAQSIVDNTKQQLSQAAQQYGGIAQQYAQQQGQAQGQQLLQNVQQNKPQSAGAAATLLESNLSTFGTGLWDQVQASNTGQQNTLPQTQQISMVYGQLSQGISMYSTLLKNFQLPVGVNGGSIPVWLNELQNLSTIVAAIGTEIQAGTLTPYATGVNALISFIQQHNAMVYPLANQQAGNTILPGNANWDYFVNMNGQRFDQNGNSLNAISAGYSAQNIATIEAKRSQMATLIVSLLNLVVRNGNALAQIDEDLPNEVLSIITPLISMSPTDPNASAYIAVAQNQQKAIPYIISQQGLMKPADQNWSTLQDSNGNIYTLQGQFISGPKTTSVTTTPTTTSITTATSNPFASVTATPTTSTTTTAASNPFASVKATPTTSTTTTASVSTNPFATLTPATPTTPAAPTASVSTNPFAMTSTPTVSVPATTSTTQANPFL
jgi:hypothetical protein